MTHPNNLILGVDGGGSKTVAWLAVHDPPNRVEVIGRGRSGSSNCRSIGIVDAVANLEHAVSSAFSDAEQTIHSVASACLALAGADRPVEQQQFRSWANEFRLADRLTITNDAMPVLYAASGVGVGIALISGTGSVAVGRNERGDVARCGGWGSLLGDEGSGYQIALAGLRAAARAADGSGRETALLANALDYFKINEPSELIPVVYSAGMTRSEIAKIAKIIFQTAAFGDPAATEIIAQAAADLSKLVETLVDRLSISPDPIAFGVSGGVLLHQAKLVDEILRQLAESGINAVMTPVHEPAAGAVTIAMSELE